jgi:predicted membrane-bound mannosyltransferase
LTWGITLERVNSELIAGDRVAVLAPVLGLPLTYAHGSARTFGYLAGAAGLSMVLVYPAVNVLAIPLGSVKSTVTFQLARSVIS